MMINNKMNFDLENAFIVFNNQIQLTSEQWNDRVQKKFYDEYIHPITFDSKAFITVSNDLENKLKQSELLIDSLINEIERLK